MSGHPPFAKVEEFICSGEFSIPGSVSAGKESAVILKNRVDKEDPMGVRGRKGSDISGLAGRGVDRAEVIEERGWRVWFLLFSCLFTILARFACHWGMVYCRKSYFMSIRCKNQFFARFWWSILDENDTIRKSSISLSYHKNFCGLNRNHSC